MYDGHLTFVLSENDKTHYLIYNWSIYALFAYESSCRAEFGHLYLSTLFNDLQFA